MSSPPQKRQKQEDERETRTSLETLFRLDPAQVASEANPNHHERLLEFARVLQEQVLIAAGKHSQQEQIVTSQEDENSTDADSESDKKSCTECTALFSPNSLTACSCYFEQDGVRTGVQLCKNCLADTTKRHKYNICHLCKGLKCREYKNGCNPMSCCDCSNIMCKLHVIDPKCKSCWRKCMCGKKLWCSVCSKSIDAQVKAGLTTECEDCNGVACGFEDCTIYKNCRLCRKQLCENCVFRTKCDCDETLPLCAKCEDNYVCPNPDCLGPSDDPASLILAELS